MHWNEHRTSVNCCRASIYRGLFAAEQQVAVTETWVSGDGIRTLLVGLLLLAISL